MNKRLKEIMDRKIEIRSALKDGGKELDLAAIESELGALEKEEIVRSAVGKNWLTKLMLVKYRQQKLRNQNRRIETWIKTFWTQ